MKKSIFTHLAKYFTSQYENVANRSIAYLLNEYSAARDALKILLAIEEVPRIYETEQATGENGRPDITGLNSSGQKSVIIEGKFWAKLTDHQPVNYLKELDENGKLLFLAPVQRLLSLGTEVKNRIGSSDDRIIIQSWGNFLQIIENENSKDFNKQLESDLTQIKALCEQMESLGLPPLNHSDLDPMNGKLMIHFANIIDECNPILRNWDETDFTRLNTTSTKYGYGFYFKAFGLGCYLCFDCERWNEYNTHTPFWLKVDHWQDTEIQNKIPHLLKIYDSGNSYDLYYGITIKPGMDKEDVVHTIIEKTKGVLCFLNENITNG